ncbi:MAG: leucine-rich repeat protein, partial [Prevotella sp.]
PVKITVNIEAIDTWEEYAEGAVNGTDYIKDGTTYTINTARGLAWVAYVTNNGMTSSYGDNYPGRACFGGHTIKLANDISITQPEGAPDGWATWTPIGTYGKPFLGTFDGNNHVVSNLTVSGVESAGLFGFVGKSTENKQGKISNLGVDGANVSGTTNAGVIAGQLYGTMEKCWSSGSVTATFDSGNGGGLIGEATDGSTITSCYSTATVTAYSAGGVIGVLGGTLEYCYATGKVTLNDGTNGNAGGICGTVIDGSNINNSIALNVNGITGSTTGRIWGEGSITGSSNYASTKISGTWTSDAAGKDGADVVYSEYISYVKNNWPSDVWTISNKNLPQLKDMSGQTELPRGDYMQVDEVTITITPPSRGRIEVYEDGEMQEPDGENKIAAAIGSTVTIKAIANDDYGISWLKINDELQQGATVDNYLISNDITISASFHFVIPDVFMSNGICYERLSGSSEEVAVRKLNSSGEDNYYTGDLDLQEKVVYSNDYDQAEFRLTAIADEAFEGSSELKSVALPPVIASIGSNAFKGCTGLEKLVVKSPSSVTQSATEPTVPTAGEYAFDDICETAVLYVPEGWKEAFKTASEWNKFFSIKEQREDGTVLAELTITASSGGTVSVGSITSASDTKTLKVAEGTDVIVEVTASEGYMLSSLTCNGNEVIDQLVDGKLTLTGVNGEYSIDAVFGIATSIDGTDASPIKIGTKDGAISVEGVAAGEVIYIYNASGNLLRREVANGELVEIAMPPGQVYIVNIGKQSFKLMR